MNREFEPIGPRARIASAASALLATGGILWSVLALAGHYDVEYLQVARAQSAAHAQQAKVRAG